MLVAKYQPNKEMPRELTLGSSCSGGNLNVGGVWKTKCASGFHPSWLGLQPQGLGSACNNGLRSHCCVRLAPAGKELQLLWGFEQRLTVLMGCFHLL